jgi:hypothetical protein
MAVTLQNLIKDPNANLDYVVDWTAWLAQTGDSIQTVLWVVPSGITVTAQLHTTKTATVWLSGGSVGKTYRITCRITTVAGRVEDHSFNIVMEDK